MQSFSIRTKNKKNFKKVGFPFKEENRFLRNEIQETRKLLNNILENIVSENSGNKRQEQQTVTKVADIITSEYIIPMGMWPSG